VTGKHLSVPFAKKLRAYLAKYRPIVAEYCSAHYNFRDNLDPPMQKGGPEDCCALFNMFPPTAFNRVMVTLVLGGVGANRVRAIFEYELNGNMAK
jgi:hypothetical protein